MSRSPLAHRRCIERARANRTARQEAYRAEWDAQHGYGPGGPEPHPSWEPSPDHGYGPGGAPFPRDELVGFLDELRSNLRSSIDRLTCREDPNGGPPEPLEPWSLDEGDRCRLDALVRLDALAAWLRRVLVRLPEQLSCEDRGDACRALWQLDAYRSMVGLEPDPAVDLAGFFDRPLRRIAALIRGTVLALRRHGLVTAAAAARVLAQVDRLRTALVGLRPPPPQRTRRPPPPKRPPGRLVAARPLRPHGPPPALAFPATGHEGAPADRRTAAPLALDRATPVLGAAAA